MALKLDKMKWDIDFGDNKPPCNALCITGGALLFLMIHTNQTIAFIPILVKTPTKRNNYKKKFGGLRKIA